MWEKLRCDGKKKLKHNAFPTIFPSLNLQSAKDIIFNDHNYTGTQYNEDLHVGRQSSMLTLLSSHQTSQTESEDDSEISINNSITEKETENHLDCQQNNVNIKEFSASTLANQTENEHDYEITINNSVNEEENDLEFQENNVNIKEFLASEYDKDFCVSVNLEEETDLRRQCEKLKAILKSREQMFCNIIKKSERYRLILRKRLKKLKEENKKLTGMLQNYNNGAVKSLKQVFNEDQILALTSGNHKWSDDTIEKALRLKLICGSNGYHEIIKQNIPLPSERTLRRRIGLENKEKEKKTVSLDKISITTEI